MAGMKEIVASGIKGGNLAHYNKSRKKKVKKVMHEFKKGQLRSGSKTGPVVTNPKQAIAIAISEGRGKKK